MKPSRRACARARAARARCRSCARGWPGRWFCEAEDLEHAVDLLERRVGTADDRVDLLAAAGEAGAELVEDQREPLPVGQAHDVVDQVEVDRPLGVRHRQQVLALARPRGRSSPAPAAARVPTARFCVGEHSTNFSPISDCGRTWQLGVAAEVLVRRVVDGEHDRGLEVGRDVERVDLADLHAGDLDVLAGDHEAGVVEDRAHLVAAAVAGAGGQHRGGAEASRRRTEATRFIRGPAAPGSGRSRRRRGCRRRGSAPSRPPAAGSPRPGSGAFWYFCEAVEAAVRSRSATSVAAGRGVGELEGVEDRLDAGEVAVGVVVGGRPGRSRGTSRRARACTGGCTRAPAGDFTSACVEFLNAGLATCCSAGILRVASTRSLFAPGRRDQAAQVVDRRARARAPAGAARAGTARGPWSPAWTRRPAGRGRRASRAGSRTSCWRAAAWSAAAPAPARARRSRTAIAPAVVFVFADQRRRGRRAARRSRSPRARS